MEFAFTPEDLLGLPRIVVICGPTGVGKTAFSLALAEAVDGEIVGADSLQVYRHLDIGTAKASPKARARIPHHVIDVVDPDEDFNAADYRAAADEAIADIRQRGKVPIVVGGTGLYIRLLVHGLFDAPEPSEELRRAYRIEADEHGVESLYRRLEEVDPELAARVNPNDYIRITRGLEIFDQTGTPITVHQRNHRFSRPHFNALKIALVRPRPELYERINLRVDQMIDEGLIDEYRGLNEMGYGPELKPLQSLGYRQIGQHLFEGLPLDEAIEGIKSQTRRYAKQQLSWFRKEPGVKWAMAPILVDEKIPSPVLADIEAHLRGEQPGLEWARVDPYNVMRTPS
ncbi:MAG: tRNA (adenosine(37)-N6)-dimethylallyltransferase MiaA [Bradymonadaceae bacterium]